MGHSMASCTILTRFQKKHGIHISLISLRFEIFFIKFEFKIIYIILFSYILIQQHAYRLLRPGGVLSFCNLTSFGQLLKTDFPATKEGIVELFEKTQIPHLLEAGFKVRAKKNQNHHNSIWKWSIFSFFIKIYAVKKILARKHFVGSDFKPATRFLQILCDRVDARTKVLQRIDF